MKGKIARRDFSSPCLTNVQAALREAPETTLLAAVRAKVFISMIGWYEVDDRFFILSCGEQKREMDRVQRWTVPFYRPSTLLRPIANQMYELCQLWPI